MDHGRSACPAATTVLPDPLDRGGAWDDVLCQHAARPGPASRAWWVVCLAAGVALLALFALQRKWVGAVGGVTSLTITVLSRRDRRVPRPTTTASGDGLLIHGVDRDRYLPWEQVLEVYPRAPWARWPTLRTPDGSTVSLPGVPDEVAQRLEQFRTHIVRRS